MQFWRSLSSETNIKFLRLCRQNHSESTDSELNLKPPDCTRLCFYKATNAYRIREERVLFCRTFSSDLIWSFATEHPLKAFGRNLNKCDWLPMSNILYNTAITSSFDAINREAKELSPYIIFVITRHYKRVEIRQWKRLLLVYFDAPLPPK